MKITLTIPDNFLDDILQNLPEYAISFDCTYFDYDRCIYKLTDCEDGAKYTLTREKAHAGLEMMIDKLMAGKLPGLELSSMNWFDPANWDSIDTDCLIQCALLGDVIYG